MSIPRYRTALAHGCGWSRTGDRSHFRRSGTVSESTFKQVGCLKIAVAVHELSSTGRHAVWIDRSNRSH